MSVLYIKISFSLNLPRALELTGQDLKSSSRIGYYYIIRHEELTCHVDRVLAFLEPGPAELEFRVGREVPLHVRGVDPDHYPVGRAGGDGSVLIDHDLGGVEPQALEPGHADIGLLIEVALVGLKGVPDQVPAVLGGRDHIDMVGAEPGISVGGIELLEVEGRGRQGVGVQAADSPDRHNIRAVNTADSRVDIAVVIPLLKAVDLIRATSAQTVEVHIRPEQLTHLQGGVEKLRLDLVQYREVAVVQNRIEAVEGDVDVVQLHLVDESRIGLDVIDIESLAATDRIAIQLPEDDRPLDVQAAVKPLHILRMEAGKDRRVFVDRIGSLWDYAL